jgi:endonuclease-3
MSPKATVDRESETKRIASILRLLRRLYPEAHCALEYRDPYELLVATILSAQSTDARVNMVTPALFDRYPDPHTLAEARQSDVEQLVHSCGFYRSKARNLIGMAQRVVELHAGEIPADMDALLELPGVARKTANVVLGNAFDIASGVVVDTHVGRISRRLCLSRESDPVKVEQDLVALLPRQRWIVFSHELIQHGRGPCSSRSPSCGDCALARLCPSAPTDGEPPSRRRSAAQILGHRRPTRKKSRQMASRKKARKR